MHGQAFGMDDVESEARQKRRNRSQAVEGQVFVIERIPLDLLVEIAGIHDFETEIPIRFQQNFRPLEYRHRVRVMRERVTARNDIDRPQPFVQDARGVRSEIAGCDLKPLIPSHGANILGNINTSRSDSQFGQRLQEDAVIAPEFNNLLRSESVAAAMTHSR